MTYKCHFLPNSMTSPGLENKNHFPWLFLAVGTLTLGDLNEKLQYVYKHVYPGQNGHIGMLLTGKVLIWILDKEIHRKYCLLEGKFG